MYIIKKILAKTIYKQYCHKIATLDTKKQMYTYLTNNISKTTNTVLTAYHWPDIDGIAGIYALSELLNKLGHTHCTPKISQIPQFEALWAIKLLGLKFLEIEKSDIYRPIILVDVSDPLDLPKEVLLENVIAVIDHRSYYEATAFKNALCWIEETGSASTMIVELYRHSLYKPSSISANLLYLAIISNTINLMSHNTTDLDKEAIQWVKSFITINKIDIDAMLNEKSQINDIYQRIDNDTSSKCHIINEKLTVIAQLELVDAKKFILNNIHEIVSSLNKVMSSRFAKNIFIIIVDTRLYETYFIFLEGFTRKFVEQFIPLMNLNLNLSGKVNCGFVNDVYIRKEIIKICATNT